jgi:FkbM family methyltransferase
MPDLARLWGMGRSVAIYHRPGRGRRLDRFYGGMIAPGDLCFDVGAHVGDRSRCFRRLGARVVAVEPQPGFDRLLVRLFRADPGVIVLAKALAAAPGTIGLRVSSTRPAVSTGSAGFAAAVAADPGFHAVHWDVAATVEATTLDALISAHGAPAFVKIDVEGMEAEVLAGLSRPVRYLSFEVVAAHAAGARACLVELDRLGRWAFNLVVGERLAFVAPGWIDRAGIEALIMRLAESGRSGDVYARSLDQS